MHINPVNEILKDRGMTQVSLAEDLLVTPEHLNGVINCKRSSGILQHRIAKKLDIPLNQLWPPTGRAPRAKASP